MRRTAFLLFLLALGACDDADRRALQSSTDRDPAAMAATSRAAAEAIAARLNLPAPLLVARQVEERVGDGLLGPSDLLTFTFLEVPKDALATWAPNAERLNVAPSYVEPKQSEAWIGREAFAGLEFFDASPLLPHQGWIGLARAEGRIYVFTFTT